MVCTTPYLKRRPQLQRPRTLLGPVLGPRLGMMLGCLTAVLAAGGAAAQDNLPAPVHAALAKAGLPEEALAAVAIPLSQTWPHSWQRAWRYQAERPMQPGSSMKLVTSIVALDRLGPNLRGSTELRSAAPLRADGTLQGDLVLRGGADPDFGVPQLWALLAELRQAGVSTLSGNLLVDRTRWQPARSDVGLPPFDGAPEFPYNVIPDALNLAGSLLPLRLSSTSGSLQASTVPPLLGLRLESHMTLTDGRCGDWDDGWQPARLRREVASASAGASANAGAVEHDTVIELHGQFPKDCAQRVELQLIDRAELTERLFATLWQQLGGRWSGRAVEAHSAADLPADTRLLVRRQSRTWGEVLRPMNKQSDNALTRMLYLNLATVQLAPQSTAAGSHTPSASKAMAAATGTTPPQDTAQRAALVVQDWLAEQGIDSRGLVMDNGSGLSRSERITPSQLASMLKVAQRSSHAADLMMSLPTVGVDGTMRRRLTDSPATGWARLKTGTLRNVVALAGYVNDAQSQPWAVAMMINHQNASRGRPVLDALVDTLARQGLHPGPESASGEGP